jgi:transposase
VGLLASSGRPLSQIARELGIAASMLRAWRDAGGGGNAGPPRRSNTQAAAPYSGTDLASENARLRHENERLRMEREILKNVWPAPFASDFRDLVWSVCDNVSGLRSIGWSRWRSACSGPHKTLGVKAPFFRPGFRDTGRLSGHLASTSSKHRRLSRFVNAPPIPSCKRHRARIERLLAPQHGPCNAGELVGQGDNSRILVHTRQERAQPFAEPRLAHGKRWKCSPRAAQRDLFAYIAGRTFAAVVAAWDPTGGALGRASVNSGAANQRSPNDVDPFP